MRKSMSVAQLGPTRSWRDSAEDLNNRDFDWMNTYKPMKPLPAKMELPYFDESFRLFVNVKRDYRTNANNKKLIVMVAPNMTIAQLKIKVEKEFNELFAEQDPLKVGSIRDLTGFVLSNGSLVADNLKHGDTVDAVPEITE